MRKKIKTRVNVTDNPSRCGFKALCTGDKVLYLSSQLLDVSQVSEIDAKANTAKLSNGLILSRTINPDGSLTRMGLQKVGVAIYHIYDDYAKSLESDHKNRIKIGLFLAKLNKNKENLSGSNLTSLVEKLEALEEMI